MAGRRETWFDPSGTRTVIVPDDLRDIFDAAQESVREYFTSFVADPATGRIEIGDDRYVFIRASALSIDFLDTVSQLYGDRDEDEAQAIGRAFLFDIAHTIGKNDARTFHKKMGLTDPIARLATGPVHFAYSGWALVSLADGATPTPDENFFLSFEHPYSFEADSWLRAGRTSKSPVCIMSSGYSSGWTEESFGLPLTSVEYSCRARGDDACAFIMAPPERIEERLREHTNDAAVEVSIPTYFARKREEDALRHSERRLGSMLAAMPLPVLIADDDAHLMYCNADAESVFGLRPGKQPIVPLAAVFESSEALGELLAAANRGEQIVGREHRLTNRHGEPFSALVSCHPLVLPDGEGGAVITTQDITEFKEAQAAVRLNERMATVGTLASGVAHEINNPLAYVIANLEHIASAIATGAPLDRAVVSKSVDRALEGAQRVSRIVRDLRHLSRDESEDDVDALETVAIEGALESVIAIAEVTWRHRASIVRDYNEDPEDSEGPLMVRANGSRLSQVFLNVIVNAAQAITEGAADANQITVGTRAVGSDWVDVEISDTGRGIDDTAIERIYDPFYTTKKVGEGTGLGLAISKSIIDKLGGDIAIDSEPGRGTTVRIRLPRANPRGDSRPGPPASQKTLAHDLSGVGILIVDDEPALTEILGEMLAECAVTVADSGRSAREALASDTFDLILCDLMMPDVTGMDLYRSAEPSVRERMMFMTGGAFSPAAAEFVRGVDNPCLEKPVELSELRQAISAHLARLRA